MSLRKTGATWKGLCPFHGEKTPSFHVNREKGFFHCFGCGVGGDVIKFVELHEKVGFTEAVRMLAARFGLAVPEPTEDRSGIDNAEREALLKVHEVAQQWFAEQLASPAGARVRQQLADRGIATAQSSELGSGIRAFVARGVEDVSPWQGLWTCRCSCAAASSSNATAATSSIGSAAG